MALLGPLAAHPVPFAHNEPVLVVPPDNPAGLRTFADLPKARRIVLGAAEVPIGAYSNRILAKAGLDLEGRVVSRELNVRQVLAKVTLGEAEAGIVYRTDAIAAHDTVEIVEIPAPVNVVAEYPVAIVKATAQPALAAAWCELLLSGPGRAALARSGFLPDELAAAATAPATAPGTGPKP